MSTHVVEDSTGRTWHVGVPLLPWRPRWRGLRPWGRRDAGDRETVEPSTDVDAHRRRYEVGDAAGEAVFHGVLELPAHAFSAAIGEGLAPALLAAVAAVVATIVVLGGALLALELVIALVLSMGAIALRIILRRPWLVVAVTDDEQLSWPVVGLSTARSHAAAVAAALTAGVELPPPRSLP